MSTSPKSYHHGDLRAALLKAAIELLESGESFSMRAIARRAGVSQTAPYRHFTDRMALENAVAAQGFTELTDELTTVLDAAGPDASAQVTLADLATTYVMFALRRPAEFRIMFGNECDEEDAERVRAAQGLHAVLHAALRTLFPASDISNLSVALWSMAHGLAFLHLDGKLRPEPLEAVETRVRASVAAALAINAISEEGADLK